MDVKTVFLNGCNLKTESDDSKFMASHQWYHKFYQVIASYGFEAIIVYDCVYHKFSKSKYIFLILCR
ncbi:hypothetical protein CR513_10100, partial [Mucuna pruriens]